MIFVACLTFSEDVGLLTRTLALVIPLLWTTDEEEFFFKKSSLKGLLVRLKDLTEVISFLICTYVNTMSPTVY